MQFETKFLLSSRKMTNASAGPWVGARLFQKNHMALKLPSECTRTQWRIQDFPNGGALFCRKWGGAHPVFR